jgi:poly(3-hydroxybutyrate) depolymerase
MLARIEADFCVDKSRYFSDRMSYGGIVSFTITCQMPDVFRAVGSMSGSMFGSSRSCVKRPIAAWLTHGDADTVLAISGSITARDLIIANNGCATTNTQETTVTDRQFGTVTCMVHGQCSAGNYPVVWCPVIGERHAIPSIAGAEIAKFFEQF